MSDPRILSDEQLAAIRERCDKATPGPWRESRGCVLFQRTNLEYYGTYEGAGEGKEFPPYGISVEGAWKPKGGELDEGGVETAVFIAASRTDIPALLASHAALTEQLDIARRNSEQVQRLVHDLMEEQLQE